MGEFHFLFLSFSFRFIIVTLQAILKIMKHASEFPGESVAGKLYGIISFLFFFFFFFFFSFFSFLFSFSPPPGFDIENVLQVTDCHPSIKYEHRHSISHSHSHSRSPSHTHTFIHLHAHHTDRTAQHRGRRRTPAEVHAIPQRRYGTHAHYIHLNDCLSHCFSFSIHFHAPFHHSMTCCRSERRPQRRGVVPSDEQQRGLRLGVHGRKPARSPGCAQQGRSHTLRPPKIRSR